MPFDSIQINLKANLIEIKTQKDLNLLLIWHKSSFERVADSDQKHQLFHKIQ